MLKHCRGILAEIPLAYVAIFLAIVSLCFVPFEIHWLLDTVPHPDDMKATLTDRPLIWLMRRAPLAVMLLGLIATVKDEDNRKVGVVAVGLGFISIMAWAVAGAVAGMLALNFS